jgi:superfamily I DNA/RNA helicase
MRRLDPAQSAAAKGRAAIQLTLAGPGSGKTSTLTGRFVHLIRQGLDPTRILAVTFTKKAADEMRRRIATLLELPSPSGLHVMTFHAFAFRLLKKNPGVAGLSEGFRLWDTAEQRNVFSSRLMWWNEETDILDIIGGAKERLLDADGFAASIDRDDDALVEAVEYFRVYQQALRDAAADVHRGARERGGVARGGAGAAGGEVADHRVLGLGLAFIRGQKGRRVFAAAPRTRLDRGSHHRNRGSMGGRTQRALCRNCSRIRPPQG